MDIVCNNSAFVLQQINSHGDLLISFPRFFKKNGPLQFASHSQCRLGNTPIQYLCDFTNYSCPRSFRVHKPKPCMISQSLPWVLLIHQNTKESYRFHYSINALALYKLLIPYQASICVIIVLFLFLSVCSGLRQNVLLINVVDIDLIRNVGTPIVNSLMFSCVHSDLFGAGHILTFHLSLRQSECTGVGVAMGYREWHRHALWCSQKSLNVTSLVMMQFHRYLTLHFSLVCPLQFKRCGSHYP